MKRSKVIGLTGGIATGKSTVTKILIQNNYKVIDADKIAREVVEIGKPAYNGIVKNFGKQILNSDLTINRKILGKIVFNNEHNRRKLNNIVHPRIYEAIKEKILSYSKIEKVIFVDLPLLIEELEACNKNGVYFDEIWLVYVNEKVQIRRLMNRDNISFSDANKRIRAQMPIELKKKYANIILDNSTSLEELKKQVEKLLNIFV